MTSSSAAPASDQIIAARVTTSSPAAAGDDARGLVLQSRSTTSFVFAASFGHDTHQYRAERLRAPILIQFDAALFADFDGRRQAVAEQVGHDVVIASSTRTIKALTLNNVALASLSADDSASPPRASADPANNEVP